MSSRAKEHERRRQQRLPRIEKLFLQTLAGPAPDGGRRTIPGSTADISVDGMQICASDVAASGCPVEIWIEAPGGWHGKLLLPGVVRWHSCIGNGAAYLIGVELKPQLSKDLATWADLVHALSPVPMADATC